MDTVFHGTTAAFNALPASPHGSIFWTATNAAIAQHYIPRAPYRSTLVVYRTEMSERVRPHRPGVSTLWDIATLIQPELIAEVRPVVYDDRGSARSYRVSDAHPTVGDICKALENVFGYEPELTSETRTYNLRAERLDAHGRFVYAAAHWRLPGYLWVVNVPSDLRLADLTHEAGDLQDPQYNHLGRFEALRASGYDGVVINDFVQSDNWGTVGHISIGLFASAMPRLSGERITAGHFDWGVQPGEFLGVEHTPEFLAWERLTLKKAA